MPDGSSLPEIKISELPVATSATATDQLEANQAGVTRSITVGQVVTLANTMPAGSIAFGSAAGVVTGNSSLTWNDTGKNFAITGYTGAAAAFSAAGSVPASPAVDAFLMSIANPSGNTGNIFRLRAGAAGTTDQFKVDMTGDGAFSGSIQAFALSAPPAGGGNAFGIFLGNFTGGNSGLYFGTGAPTLSTFGRYGSLYINTATPGIPYYNNNGTTGWDRLVGETSTQTLTNKTLTSPTITGTPAITGYLPLGGGTLTGALTGTSATYSGIVTSTNTTPPGASFRVDGAAATNRTMGVSTAGALRWTWGGNTAGEGGSNAGSDFTINAYADAGTFLNTPVIITRSTGTVALAGALTGTSAMFGQYGTIVPHSSMGGTSNVTPNLQVAFGGLGGISVQRYSAGSNPPIINLSKSATNTTGSQTIVQTTDILGDISFNGSDGVKFIEGAYIHAEIDGTPALNGMPTRLTFAVAPTGSATPAEALRINNAGSVIAKPATAIPAGGTAGAGYLFSSTANFGTIFGSGAPTASMARGSLYLRSDGGGPYVNTDGATTWTPVGANKSLQTQSVETGAVATGTTIIPLDDTIPQQTEGDQYMTLTITPQSATSKLIIEVAAQLGASANVNMIMALFQDATANALAAVYGNISASSVSNPYPLRHVMTSGTTSATTFKVRAGPATAATTTFNGQLGGRIFGGVMASSIVITEVLP